MEELLTMKVDDLLALIKSHKEELQNEGETELEDVTDQIRNFGEKVSFHFSKLLQELADRITELDTRDFPSLLLFIEKSGITGDEVIWNYLKQVGLENDIDRKTLLLKISYLLDPVWFSKDILNKYQEIKNKHPLFWCDLLFKSDKNEAIRELGNYIKEKKVSFSFLYPVVNRWIRIAKKEEFSENFANSIYSWKSNLKGSDSELFLLWLNENGINTVTNEIITNFSKDSAKERYIICN